MDSLPIFWVIAAPVLGSVALLVLAWRNHAAADWLRQREARFRERQRQAQLAARVAAFQRKAIWQDIEQLHSDFVARTGFTNEWQRGTGAMDRADGSVVRLENAPPRSEQ